MIELNGAIGVFHYTNHGKGFWEVTVIWILGLSADDVEGCVGDARVRSVLRGEIKDAVSVLTDPDAFLRSLLVIVLKMND